MKLSYRGVKYDQVSSSIEFDQREIGGKYRGQVWHHKYPRHIPDIKPKIYRQYRGVAYSTCPLPLQPIPTPKTAKPLAYESYCRINSQKKISVNHSAHIHLENIRRSLEHRLTVAKARGDEQLVDLLEKESAQLSLS